MGWLEDVGSAVGIGGGVGGTGLAALGTMTGNPVMAGLGAAQGFLGANGGIQGMIGGITGQGQTDAALRAQQQGVAGANAAQLQGYTDSSQALQPYSQAGLNGLNNLTSAMPGLTANFDPSNLQNTPGYQFALNQGLNAINSSASARGLLNSGGTMASLNNYAQNAAGQQYQNAFNNYQAQNQQNYNMLSGIAGIGQNAAAQQVGVNTNYANQVGSNDMGGANAAAAAQIAQGNRNTGFLGQLVGSGATVGAAALKG